MKFKPRSESTRQFIIESTANLFNIKGYSGTSMSDIEEVTGLTKGSIYGNFDNKEEVALAVFDYNLNAVLDKMAIGIDRANTNKEKLLSYVELYSLPKSQFVFQFGGCPLLNTGIEADDTNPVLKKRVEMALLAWKNKLSSIIKEGIECGEFHSNTDIELTALSIIAIIQGGVFIAKTLNDLEKLDLIMKTLRRIIEDICI